MANHRKKYTKEEKLEIIKLSFEEGQSVQGLADRFGVNANTIYNWRSSYTKHKEASFPGNGNKILTEAERKMEALEREVRELKLERDILKKAVGIFSRNDRKFSNL